MKINWPEKDDTDIDYGAGWNACLEACKKAAAIPAPVFIVEFGEYSSRSVAGVFSTKELAQEYVAKRGHDSEDIEEFGLDEYVTHVRGSRYEVLIDLETGDILEQKTWPSVHDCHLRSGPPEINDFRDHPKSGIGPFSVPSFGYLSAQVSSYLSMDHALKLAAECRQSYLRNQSQIPSEVGK